MLLDWTAECSADDPVLVIPWAYSDQAYPDLPGPDQTGSPDPTGHAHAPRFIDLREHPYDLHQIPEAEANPPLLQALRALNAPRSPVFTAKCDAWRLTPGTDVDELDELRISLDLDLHRDLEPDAATHGFVSYIDLLWRDRAIFTSFHQHELLLDRLGRRVAPLDHPQAMLSCVIRPAFLDLAGPQQGFSLSLYVKSAGPDPETAWQSWAEALGAVVPLLRSKDFSAA